jgi:hypothetical protein
MFKARKLYRNRNCLDIDFEVRSVLGELDTSILLIVGYWNRQGFWQGRSQVVIVQKKDLENWREIPWNNELRSPPSPSGPRIESISTVST